MPLEEALRARIADLQLPEGSSVRIAGPADFPALSDINAEAVAYTGEDVYGRQNEGFFTKIHGAGAVLMLIRVAGRAQGYSVAGPADRMAGLFADEPDKGLLFGTALRAGIRGLGWQRRMIDLRLAAVFDTGFTAGKAFVSPWNHGSLRNLLASGFAVVAHDHSYYGQHRFIVEVPSGGWCRAGDVQRREPLPPDGALERHRALLEAGWKGRAVEPDGPALVYGRAEAC